MYKKPICIHQPLSALNGWHNFKNCFMKKKNGFLQVKLFKSENVCITLYQCCMVASVKYNYCYCHVSRLQTLCPKARSLRSIFEDGEEKKGPLHCIFAICKTGHQYPLPKQGEGGRCDQRPFKPIVLLRNKPLLHFAFPLSVHCAPP